MENISRNLEKDVNKLKIPEQEKRKKRWTLLMIADNGKVVMLKGYKFFLGGLFALLLTATGVAIALSYLYMNLKSENTHLIADSSEAKQQVDELKDEMDLLMARLIVTESKIESIHAEDPPPPAKKDSAKNDVATVTTTPPPLAKPPEKVEDDVNQTSNIVEIKNFKVFRIQGTSNLRVRFDIKKIAPGNEAISGRTFIILKKKGDPQEAWSILPSVSLRNGIPALKHRGQFFSISRFKHVNYKVDNFAFAKEYDTGTVIVFSTTGEMILKNTIPFKLESAVSDESN